MALRIASPQNERIKKVVRSRNKRDRDKTGLFVVEGCREIERALDAGFTLEELYLLDPPCSDDAAQLVDRVTRDGFQKCVLVTQNVFSKLVVRENRDGLFAVFRQRHWALADLQPKRLGAWFLMMVDGLEKPGNLGALVRTADGAGVDAILVCGSELDIFNPHAIRSSIGALFHVPVIKASETELSDFLRREDVLVLAAIPAAAAPYYAEDLRKSVCLILGSEAFGVSAYWQQQAHQQVTIPMLGRGDSLNISVAGAVMAYEVCRQRLCDEPVSDKAPRT